MHAIVIFLLFFGTTLLVYGQDEGSCTTPRGEQGTCISIAQCKGLETLFRNNANSQEVRNYLIRSTCGYSGFIPLLCCPQEQIAVTDTPTVYTTNPISTNPGIVDGSNTPRSDNPIDALLRYPSCGLSNGTFSRIVGGVPAKLGEFPWATILGYKNANNPRQPKWLCGGTLITDRHILTAAHCVYNRPDLYLARLGDLDLYSDNDGAIPQDIPLISAKLHEDYSPKTFTNDIAILTLAQKPDMSSVWPVCLPVDPPLRDNNFENTNGWVIGWGRIEFNGLNSPNLLKVLLPIVQPDTCKEAYKTTKSIIDERVLCAGYLSGGKDACQGDSGGPYMFGKAERKNIVFYQTGVVSYGFKCAEAGYPGVYTRVTSFIDWIARNVAS